MREASRKGSWSSTIRTRTSGVMATSSHLLACLAIALSRQRRWCWHESGLATEIDQHGSDPAMDVFGM